MSVRLRLGRSWTQVGTYDDITEAFVDSTESPYTYDLAGCAYFRITDDFIVGDTFYVYDFGSLILTTTADYAGAPTGFDAIPGESGVAKCQLLGW